MPDYKAMYYNLFNKVTDAIHVLQEAQIEGEEAYIADDTGPMPLGGPFDESGKG